MSRAFVKNDGESAAGEPVERKSSGRPNYVTPQGLRALEAKTAEIARLREKLLADGSTDEGGGLELRQAELDLRYYEGQAKRAIVVDNGGASFPDVRFGAAVSVLEEGGAEREFLIVGEDEADAAAGRLNWASPLAGALLGARAGDSVVWPRKTGDYRLEILSVRYPG